MENAQEMNLKLGRSRYRTSDQVALEILDYLYENGPTGPTRLIYVAQSTLHQWRKLSADMFASHLIKEVRSDKRRIGSHEVAITERGIEYMKRTHAYQEEIARIKAGERALRKGAYDYPST